MKIDINGDPGTGNIFTEINVEKIETVFTNTKEAKIIKGVDGQETIVVTGDSNTSSADPKLGNKEAKRADILKYVGKTLPLVLYDWKDKYLELWSDILDIPAVDAMIYKKGRQQKTSFNRKEVLHIICYLGKEANGGIGLFEDRYVATRVAHILDDGCEKTTRPELGFFPPLSIRKAIDALMNSKKY